MRECLDEGILQGYFDSELSGERMELVTSHLASCKTCAVAARELEDEGNLVSAALAPELASAVPTERLRKRIDSAIGALPVTSSAAGKAPVFIGIRAWVQSLAGLFALAPQRAFGYAGLLLVLAFAAIFGIMQSRRTPSLTYEGISTVAKSGKAVGPLIKTATEGASTHDTAPPVSIEAVKSAGQKLVHPRKRLVVGTDQAVAQVKLLPGERSYLKTIAALDTTINSTSNRPMRPALRAEYERNLALVDRALAATRNAAKKNPDDPDAAEFMFNAYQSKVNLLNTVADARSFNRPQ